MENHHNTSMDICALQDVLSYKNDNVIYKFMETYSIKKELAEDIFDETKKWLWLSAYRIKEGRKEHLIIDNSLLVIDAMWHTFILFTKDYTSFCSEHFGFYINHAPTTKADKEDFEKKKIEDFDALVKEERSMYEKQYSFIYDLLGEDTLIKWYRDYKENFTVEKLYFLRNKNVV